MRWDDSERRTQREKACVSSMLWSVCVWCVWCVRLQRDADYWPCDRLHVPVLGFGSLPCQSLTLLEASPVPHAALSHLLLNSVDSSSAAWTIILKTVEILFPSICSNLTQFEEEKKEEKKIHIIAYCVLLYHQCVRVQYSSPTERKSTHQTFTSINKLIILSPQI